MNLGDLLVLACAVLFALHIVLLGRWSPGTSSAPLAMTQMGMCTLVFSAGGTWSLRAPSAEVWFAIVVTGLFASAFAYFIQTWAQAQLLNQQVAHAWRLWEFPWRTPAQAGRVTLMARATDARMRQQPTERDGDRRNYVVNHVLPVEVTVQ